MLIIVSSAEQLEDPPVEQGRESPPQDIPAVKDQGCEDRREGQGDWYVTQP